MERAKKKEKQNKKKSTEIRVKKKKKKENKDRSMSIHRSAHTPKSLEQWWWSTAIDVAFYAVDDDQ